MGVNEGDFTAFDLAKLLISISIYAAVVLFGLDSLGKAVFRRSQHDGGNQFLFVLLAVFLASVSAELIGIEKIVGAFLAGLAVNDVVGDGPVKEKTEFFGSVLFIPIFFIQMGLLLDLEAFEDIFRSVGIPLSIVAALIISKFLAAYVAKLLYRYSWQQTITMWSLSLPQVAATLAAALVAFQAQIINERVFNSVILLMLVTAVAGPLITARAAEKLTFASDEDTDSKTSNLPAEIEPFRVVVPVYNPQTERFLLELASLLAQGEGGEVVPLAIARAQARLDSPQLDSAIARSQKLLTQAKEIGEELSIAVKPELRIDYDVAQSISHTSREVNANLILLGFSSGNMFQSRLFGTITDSVLWSAHCSVAVARLLDSPLKIKRILVPIENLSPEGLLPLRLAQNLAATPGTEITLLHVCPTRTSKERKTRLHQQLEELTSWFSDQTTVDVRVMAESYYVMAILNASKDRELVILRSQRKRIGADGLALSPTTKPLLESLDCSVILLGEP